MDRLNFTFTILFCLITLVYTATPYSCIRNSRSMDEVSVCFGQFMRDSASSGAKTNWPSVSERVAFKELVKQLLSNGNSARSVDCIALGIPDILSEKVAISQFQNPTTSKKYCILYEKIQNGKFRKGWVWVAIPKERQFVAKNLHFSAPHVMSDRNSDHQAAALFERVGARSLIISTSRRDQSTAVSKCQTKSETADYYANDAAHETQTMFHHAAIAIYEWHFQHLKTCPSDSCAFIQLHGMASTSCPGINVFISGGIYRSEWSIEHFHSRSTLPANRLESSFSRNRCNDWVVRSVQTNGSCQKRGTHNILGRVINGVTIGTECSAKPDVKKAPGYFIHIEQTPNARASTGYQCWAQVLKLSFIDI